MEKVQVQLMTVDSSSCVYFFNSSVVVLDFNICLKLDFVNFCLLWQVESLQLWWGLFVQQPRPHSSGCSAPPGHLCSAVPGGHSHCHHQNQPGVRGLHKISRWSSLLWPGQSFYNELFEMLTFIRNKNTVLVDSVFVYYTVVNYRCQYFVNIQCLIIEMCWQRCNILGTTWP